MKVAVVTPLLAGHLQRGVGVYTRNLVSSLRRVSEVTIEEVTVHSIPKNADVIHVTYFDPFFLTLPFPMPSKTIVTIHDVIPIKFPQHFPKGINGTIKWRIQQHLVRQAARIITDSEASKRDIGTFLKIPNEKIDAIALGVDSVFFKKVSETEKKTLQKKYNLPSKFGLFVGDIGWNKNVSTIVRACRNSNLPLVIVSRTLSKSIAVASHPSHTSWLKELHDEMKTANILILDAIDEEELVGLYQTATVFLFPSFYEGFGLPVLEAFASGCSVITTHGGSLQEIVRDNAWIVDPQDVEKMSMFINRIVENTQARNKYLSQAKAWAGKYSWDETAKKTAELYKKIAVKQ